MLDRVRHKEEKYNLDSTIIARFYETQIIPLTIEGEVQYFLKRNFPE